MSYATLFPFSVNWLVSILILIVASRPDSISEDVRHVLTSWIGLSGLFAIGLVIFTDKPVLATAVYLLMFALLAEEHRTNTREHFRGGSDETHTDMVTSNKKWMVEKILDERPVAISDRTVTTYPPSN